MSCFDLPKAGDSSSIGKKVSSQVQLQVLGRTGHSQWYSEMHKFKGGIMGRMKVISRKIGNRVVMHLLGTLSNQIGSVI